MMPQLNLHTLAFCRSPTFRTAPRSDMRRSTPGAVSIARPAASAFAFAPGLLPRDVELLQSGLVHAGHQFVSSRAHGPL